MTTVTQERVRQTTTSIRFSTTHGQNTQLENHGKFAYWKLIKHYGTCFTNRSLLKGENLKFKLDGSGHVLLGLLRAKPPDPSAIQDVEATTIEPKGHWTHFRFKRETTSVSLNRVKTREIEFTRFTGGKTEKKSIPIQNQDLYVFFEIQFGNICIDIESDELKKPIWFDIPCGANIKLERQQSRTQLKHANVSAICGTDRPLARGEEIDLSINPIDNANWTYANLFISNKNASELEIHKHDSFDRNRAFLYPSDGIKVDKKGTVQLRLTEYGEIAYSVRTEQRKVEITGNTIDLSMPLFLYVELFRVRVGLESVLPEVQEETYLRAVDKTEETYITPIADTCQDEVSYLQQASRHDDKTHHYEKLIGTITVLPDNPSRRRDFELNQTAQNTSSEDNEGYIEMLPAISDDCVEGQETQPKQISDEDSITELKQLDRDAPAIKEQDEKSLPKGVKREVPRPPLPSRDGEAEASGPADIPIVPPRRPSSASAGPELLPHANSRLQSQAMTVQQPPLENILARVQVLEHTTGLPVPSVESPIGTSGEEVLSFSEMIRKNYIQLLDRLEPDPVADHLFQEGKMSHREHDSFLENDRKGKCRAVLKILQQRPSTKGIFITALNNSSQEDIVNLLRI